MILLLFASLLTTGARGQSYSPEAGNKSVSQRLGREVAFGDPQYRGVYERAISENYYSWDGVLPAFQNQPGQPSSFNLTSSNAITNIIGAEIKYFISSQLAARFSGGGAMMSSPSADARDSYNESAKSGHFLQGWQRLEGCSTMKFYGDLGFGYYFSGKYEQVNSYVGLQGNVFYFLMEIFDGYGGLDDKGKVVSSLNFRSGEGYAPGGTFVSDLDYYLTGGLMPGMVEGTVCSYIYNVKRVFHETGMEPQEACTHQTSFLSQPVIKLGSRF